MESLLADTSRLLINSEGLRWNVERHLFKAVREMTSEHAHELFDAIDDIAECLRSSGHKVLQRFDKLPSKSMLDDIDRDQRTEVQVEQLAESHEKLANRLTLRVEPHSALALGPPTAAAENNATTMAKRASV